MSEFVFKFYIFNDTVAGKLYRRTKLGSDLLGDLRVGRGQKFRELMQAFPGCRFEAVDSFNSVEIASLSEADAAAILQQHVDERSGKGQVG